MLGYSYVILLAHGGQPQMETPVVGSSSLFIIGIDLVFGCTYIQFDKISSLLQGTSGNMCKADHQAFSYKSIK